MNTGYKKKHYNRSLLFKVLFIYFLIFAVPMILLYSSLYRTSKQLTEKEGASQLLSSLTSISNTMDEVFRSVNFIQTQLQGNTAFSNDCFLLTDDNITDINGYKNYRMRQGLSMELYKLYLSNPYLYSLEVYSSYGNTLFGNYPGSTRHVIIQPTEEQINSICQFSIASDNDNNKSWHVLSSNPEETLFATYSRPFCDFNPNMYTYSRAVVSADTLYSHIRTFDPSNEICFFVLPNTEKWISLTGPDMIPADSLPFSTPSSNSGWFSFQSGKTPCIMAWFRSRYTDWYYAAAVPLEHYNVSEPLMTDYWLYIAVTLIIIFLLTALFVSFYLIRPMKQISTKMREAEHGNLDIRISSKRRDELGYIGHRLNVLLENIDSLIHTNYETKLLKEGYELKFIQTQLKEHFIYNTLDTIHWIADKNKVPQISQIIFNLSRFFRLTLNNGSDFIMIEQEANVLESYISLLNVRMDGTIRSEIQIEPSLCKERVIKYFFQPILENAVVHGLRPKGGGTVHICFDTSPSGRIRYCVRDNGTGISPIDLRDINLCIKEDQSSGKYFALINLNRQLRLYFGDNYSFSIQSQPDMGTSVSIEFPKEGNSL